MFNRFGMGVLGSLAIMYLIAMAFGANDIEVYGVIGGVDVQCAMPDDDVYVCEPVEKEK